MSLIASTNQEVMRYNALPGGIIVYDDVNICSINIFNRRISYNRLTDITFTCKFQICLKLDLLFHFFNHMVQFTSLIVGSSNINPTV